MNTAAMGELEDWEVLQSPETSLVISGDSERLIIRSDYFIVDSNSQLMVSESGIEEVVSPKDINFEEKQDLSCEDNQSGLVSEQFRGNNNELDCENGMKDDVCTIEANGETQVVEVQSDDDSGESLLASESEVSEMGNDEIEPRAVDELNSGEEGKAIVVWYKLPFELLKFCIFRVSPVWTVSFAAALMGLVILKRRLSRMKAKSRSIPIKLTVDDKKVSQFMMRASRLNEAFSVVRRVPVIRPLLPGAGVTPWPMVNLR